ncbi:MAG: response regulator [Prevotella sp.]|nr:response regulator [Prevotella sp.]
MKIPVIIVGILLLAVLLIVGRWLYNRSVRLRNRLQMDRAFTNISHELLTPLTVISASIERLRDQDHGQDSSHAAEYAMMELNVERMTRLLQEILETSKSQSGGLKLLVSQGDAMEYIRRTALSIAPLLRKKGLTFNVQCNPKSMMGWIDPDKLDKIIYNLLSNAAKYTSTPGQVDLVAQTNENYDHIIIEVRDNGIGIPAHKMKHLFQRFYDGDYRRMKVSGTGLGLALTRELTYLHGGTIDCKSKEGQGTVFTVTIPITKDAFSAQQIDTKHPIDLTTPHTNIIDVSALEMLTPPSQPVEKEPAKPLYSILLVEDNEELLMLMKTLLSYKYNVLTAANGLEALEVINKEDLDIIVADVMMPEMDGNELTRHIKGTPELSHLPVILVSAKTAEEDRKHSMLIGADDYVTKPFRLSDLKLRIDNIIENRKRILGEQRQAAADAAEARPLTPDEEFLQKAYTCVMNHLSDSEFDRDAFAVEMGASASTLYNKLRALTGQNVSTYIRDIRMKEAKRLAETQRDIRVSDLAYKVGFKDPKYFATCFKKEFGIQPSEFIDQVHAAR